MEEGWRGNGGGVRGWKVMSEDGRVKNDHTARKNPLHLVNEGFQPSNED